MKFKKVGEKINPFINFFRRLSPGFLRFHDRRLTQTEYFKNKQNYWQNNSIYLDNIINKISTDVATLKFRHVKITRKKDEPDVMQWLENSDLSNVLTVSPNDFETPVIFWANVVRKLLNDQVAVVVPTYQNGNLSSINLVDGVNDFDKEKLSVQIDNKTLEIDINSVFIFKNPKENISIGLDQITKLIDDNLRSLSYRLSDEGKLLKGFLKVPTKATDGELKKRAQLRVNNIMDAAKTAGIGFLAEGEEFQELQKEFGKASENELNFLKGQLYNAFGINEDLFTCNYKEEQYRAYFQSVLKVYQRVIGEEINRKF